MARIGKTVDVSETSPETVTNCILAGMQENAITGVNWSYNKTNKTIDIYGEDVDLATLKTFANDKGLIFDVLGDAPSEIIDVPDTPLTQDEIDALAFLKTAFNTMKIDERQRLIDLWEIAYDAINTTPIAFNANTDLKWLR